MKKTILIVIITLLILILGGILMINIFGKKYTVYINGKGKKYFPGTTVKMKFEMVMDASYHVTVKEKDIDLKTKTKKYYYIEYFKMPKHDVHITTELRGEMRYIRDIVSIYEKEINQENKELNYYKLSLNDDYYVDISSSQENETFRVNKNIEEKISEVIDKYKIKEWQNINNKDSINNKTYEITFEFENYEKLILKTENIPDEGVNAINELKELILNSKIKENQ